MNNEVLQAGLRDLADSHNIHADVNELIERLNQTSFSFTPLYPILTSKTFTVSGRLTMDFTIEVEVDDWNPAVDRVPFLDDIVSERVHEALSSAIPSGNDYPAPEFEEVQVEILRTEEED